MIRYRLGFTSILTNLRAGVFEGDDFAGSHPLGLSASCTARRSHSRAMMRPIRSINSTSIDDDPADLDMTSPKKGFNTTMRHGYGGIALNYDAIWLGIKQA